MYVIHVHTFVGRALVPFKYKSNFTLYMFGRAGRGGLTWMPLVRERLSIDKIKEIRYEKQQMLLAKRHAPKKCIHG